MWETALFALGLLGLWIGTEFVIPATITLGHRRGISPAILGLTVLAIGTDLPELLVAIDGGLHQLRGIDASGVVVGNAIGSALTQCTLVFGITLWARSSEFSPKLARRDAVALAFAVALLATLGFDGRFGTAEGLILVIAYSGYLALVIHSRHDESGDAVPPATNETRTLLAIGGGLLLVLVSAELVVANGLKLAAGWGVDQGLVGILLVGAGTSLPELVLSFGAARRGQSTLSVANLVGSNIFDLLFPVGVSALIHPLEVERGTLGFDLAAIAVAHLAAFGLLRSRWSGHRLAVVLIGLYVGFALLRIAISS
jgi:cation:H+ antiporter